MITVRSLGAPILGAHWSMGPDYMQRIGRADAARMLAPHPLPRVGYESTAAHRTRPGFFAGADVLTVQNIGGDFYAACCSARIEEWPSLFGVEVSNAQHA